nr:EOG090X0G73 [Moina brachiata]
MTSAAPSNSRSTGNVLLMSKFNGTNLGKRASQCFGVLTVTVIHFGGGVFLVKLFSRSMRLRVAVSRISVLIEQMFSACRTTTGRPSRQAKRGAQTRARASHTRQHDQLHHRPSRFCRLAAALVLAGDRYENDIRSVRAGDSAQTSTTRPVGRTHRPSGAVTFSTTTSSTTRRATTTTRRPELAASRRRKKTKRTTKTRTKAPPAWSPRSAAASRRRPSSSPSSLSPWRPPPPPPPPPPPTATTRARRSTTVDSPSGISFSPLSFNDDERGVFARSSWSPLFGQQESPHGLPVALAVPLCGQVLESHDRLVKHLSSRHKLPVPAGASQRSPASTESGAVVKGYQCDVCQRPFARSDMLTRHMRLHTGLKPYTCRICGQVFSRSDHLSTHQRTHTGEKPYRCPQCSYAACRRDMITRHLRTHTRSEDLDGLSDARKDAAS